MFLGLCTGIQLRIYTPVTWELIHVFVQSKTLKIDLFSMLLQPQKSANTSYTIQLSCRTTLKIKPCRPFGYNAIDNINMSTYELSTLYRKFLSSRHGRRGGLMVSALDSGSNGPGSSPGRGTALCSWARHFTPIVPLSTQG